MNKNYIENSLKRFLKRKVKITLGFVVAFMITGAVSFSATNENYEDYLVNNGIALEIENKETFTNYGDIKTNGIGPAFKVNGNGILFNHGNITAGEGTALQTSNEKVYNYGNLEGTKSVLNLTNSEKSEVYNYGNIIGTNNPISTWYSKELSIYNYGTIQARQFIAMNGMKDSSLFIHNYGDIFLNPQNTGYILKDITKDKTAKIENYGKIIGGHVPVLATWAGGGDLINLFYLDNYGFLRPKNGGLELWVTYKQDNKEENIKNYGIIQTQIKVTGKQSKTSLLNLGLIKGNFPTIYGATGGVNNQGVIIATDKDISKFNWNVFDNNQGAVLQKQEDGKYKLLNPDTLENNKENATIIAHGVIKDMSNETEINSSNTADNMFINDKSLALNLGEKVSNKVITAVSQTENNVVLNNDTDKDNSGNNDLTLDNTTIVGYFEKDGTLLKVDGDLTLTGNSIINAVAARDEDGNILTDAVAVDVTGNLSYTEGESHIFGIIKGGAGSNITIESENTGEGENTALNENIETSGELNLEGESWTKGQGSITLDGGKVNVGEDGNGSLVGYLFGNKDDNKTTIDGFINGNGTLNTGRIRFDLGNLDISGLNDEFVIEGNENITVGGAENQNDILDKIDVSELFDKTIENGNIVLRFKSAEDLGIYDPAKQEQYEELVKNFKDNEDFYTWVNEGDIESIKNHLGVLDAIMELIGTAGVKITRDLTGAFTDAVVEFDKKADKGQWLTNAKYIGSDMEYDGTENINGYDSDINSMVGMAEYGITENTSVGFALGGGDTEVDLKTLKGKSTSFDGNNYYAGIYAKHSVNGFDMTGSFGYTISDLDVEKGGSADSEAFTLAGYIKRDIKLADTLKLEPNMSFIYDYIMQDKAEMGEGMTIDSGDYHVFEAGLGINLVKEFSFEKGNLKLKTGVKYSMTNIERNQEITGNFYNARVDLGSPDVDDKKGNAHVGFDYEHESGVGFNGKYEMMWSDSGDDSRITAGVSYRF